LEQAKQFLENLHIFHLAESLGSVESLVDFPYDRLHPLCDKMGYHNHHNPPPRRPVMTHAAVPKEEREKLGISDTLVRLSVGVEDLDDLVRDLETALEHVKL
jgi:cystathionine gamma-lyase